MSIVALIFVPIVLAYQGWTYYMFRKRISTDKKTLGLLTQHSSYNWTVDGYHPQPSNFLTAHLDTLIMHRRLLTLTRDTRTSLTLTILSGFLAGLLTIWQAWLLSSVVNNVYMQGQTLAQVTRLLQLMLIAIGGRAHSILGQRNLSQRRGSKDQNGFTQPPLRSHSQAGSSLRAWTTHRRIDRCGS